MEYKCSVCKKKHEMYFGISAEMSPRLGEIIKEDPSRVFEAEKGMFLLDKSYCYYTKYDRNKNRFSNSYLLRDMG